MKFLHFGDIHLGYAQYNSLERKKDFVISFRNLLEKYSKEVDFILISGDLFDKQNIDARTMNHAIYALEDLKKEKIPVIAIEGNHDRSTLRSAEEEEISWLECLSGLGYIKLLKPYFDKGKLCLEKWNEVNKRGSYIDINNVRIIGSRWYGASIDKMLPHYVNAIKELPSLTYQILLLHTGIKEYIPENYGGIAYNLLEPLKEHINYIALGHIHFNYEVNNWIYNPGSTESCSIDEYFDIRGKGCYLVEINGNTHTVTHIKSRMRKFFRIEIDTTYFKTPEELYGHIIDCFKNFKSENKLNEQEQPVVELILKGSLNFMRNALDTIAIESEGKKLTNALVFNIKYNSMPIEYSVDYSSVDISREEMEKQIIHDIIRSDSRYAYDIEKYTDLIIKMKNDVLSSISFESIYNDVYSVLGGL